MKKLLMAALIGTGAAGVTSPAIAAHEGENYKNRGLCEARIAQSRNTRRGTSENAGDFNKGEISRYYCEEQADGSFTIREQDGDE